MRLPALFTAAALAASLPSAAFGQRPPPSVLLLHVTDTQGRPVPHARVTVAGVGGGTTADAEGIARMRGVPQGNRVVQAMREGYALGRVAADFPPGDTARVTLVLSEQPVELEGVTATSWGRSTRLRQNGFYDRQRQGLGAYMSADQIEHLNPLKLNEIFRYMRGFVLRPVPGAGTHDVVYTVRDPGCAPQVYLDGGPITRSARDQSDILEGIPPLRVLAVEAYPTPATIPAQYNPLGTACAVILVWTKGGEERR